MLSISDYSCGRLSQTNLSASLSAWATGGANDQLYLSTAATSTRTSTRTTTAATSTSTSTRTNTTTTNTTTTNTTTTAAANSTSAEPLQRLRVRRRALSRQETHLWRRRSRRGAGRPPPRRAASSSRCASRTARRAHSAGTTTRRQQRAPRSQAATALSPASTTRQASTASRRAPPVRTPVSVRCGAKVKVRRGLLRIEPIVLLCTGSHLVSYRAFTPSCTTNGSYAYEQCFSNLCWCLASSGSSWNYVNGSMVQSGQLSCNASGVSSAIGQLTCADGSVPQACDPEACRELLEACGGGYGNVSTLGVDCVQDVCSACTPRLVDQFGNPITSCTSTTASSSSEPGRGSCFALPASGSSSSSAPLANLSSALDWCAVLSDALPYLWNESSVDRPVWYYNPLARECSEVLSLKSLCANAAASEAILVFASRLSCLSQCTAYLCHSSSSSARACADECASASCLLYPEALCVPDPCSCEPAFYDPVTLEQVNCLQGTRT